MGFKSNVLTKSITSRQGIVKYEKLANKSLGGVLCTLTFLEEIL